MDQADSEIRRRVLRMSRDGESQRSIAGHVGIPRSRVRAILADGASEDPAPTRAFDALSGFGKAATGTLTAKRASRGGRQTIDRDWLWGAYPLILEPPDHETEWRVDELDRYGLATLTPKQLMTRLKRLSPEFSRGYSDWVLLHNPGFDVVAYALGSDDEPHEDGQAVVDAFLEQLDRRHVSRRVPVMRTFAGAALAGAFFAELVFDEAGREPVDVATPDPWTVRFRLDDDPVTGGKVWTPGQYQGGEFVAFDRETVLYVPMDPQPGNPYGTSPLASATFAALFVLGLLRDLRRVVAQQGYPRLHLKVLLEKLQAIAPSDLTADPAAMKEWVDQFVADANAAFLALEPDDNYASLDAVEIDGPFGTVGEQALGAIGDLINALERSLARSLKSNRLLMLLEGGPSGDEANREWEVLTQSIDAVQQLAAAMWGRIFTLACESRGVQCRVVVTFHKIRAAEERRDAEVQLLKDEHAAFARDQGWLDQEQASEHAVGMKPALSEPPKPEPVQAPGADPGDVSGDDGDNQGGGEERGYVDLVRATERYATALERIARAESAGDDPPVAVSGGDVDLALGTWDSAMGEAWAGLLDADVEPDEEDAA